MGLLFGLMHNYSGYPLVKEAHKLVKAGKLGQLRKVVITYAQGWLTREGSSITHTSGLSSLVHELDNFNVLLHFKGGTKGSSTGKGNGLKIEVYGSDAALEWAQEEPTHLLIHPRDTPEQLYKAGNGYLSQAATIHMHLPPGHPEGYLEAFTNIYLNFANMICATVLKDGCKGIHFVEKVLESGKKQSWVKMEAVADL
ncbi:oxidoreductaselike, putative [Acanthamoeba castellanii str. Neff]|uniref:Oxidoreductaselike, putative n=1 Tax=Acanthamoeba castellanii (strain ATCC 30010 / Neff) TaxID=1257118 RepID=L8GF64_ACACF|nr:oxidoreductaselike, putative [Acanthamoeba castellanii str. Neff]ELR10826.1 oxidoreductaselike, putative [Acanthamoeba castellanii str. Neff]